MSTDIDIYEDDAIHISATCGHWGVRLNVAHVKIGPTGKRQLLDIEYGSKLVSAGDVREMIVQLNKVSQQLDDEMIAEIFAEARGQIPETSMPPP